MSDRLPVPQRSTYLKQKQSGNGELAWQTRRANRFNTARETLSRWRTEDLEELRKASHDVSTFIAEIVPEQVTELPRGYKIATVWGQRLLSLEGSVYAAMCPAPLLASRERLAQLSFDLFAGLVNEVRESVKKEVGGGL